MKKSRSLVNVIYPFIESDGRYWHPVIEIRQRGMVIFAVAALEKSLNKEVAHYMAVIESKRIEGRSG